MVHRTRTAIQNFLCMEPVGNFWAPNWIWTFLLDDGLAKMFISFPGNWRNKCFLGQRNLTCFWFFSSTQNQKGNRKFHFHRACGQVLGPKPDRDIGLNLTLMMFLPISSFYLLVTNQKCFYRQKNLTCFGFLVVHRTRKAIRNSLGMEPVGNFWAPNWIWTLDWTPSWWWLYQKFNLCTFLTS